MLFYSAQRYAAFPDTVEAPTEVRAIRLCPPPYNRLQAEARNDLQRLGNEDFLAKWFFRTTPYAFRQAPQLYAAWQSKLTTALNLPLEAILVGGSAGSGVSLAPLKRLRPYGPHSDIDLVILSPDHFEIAWAWMRQSHSNVTLSAIQRELINDHMRRLVFFETIACDRNLQELPFGREWFACFERARADRLIAGKPVKARIYRNEAALIAYLGHGLRELRIQLGISGR